MRLRRLFGREDDEATAGAAAVDEDTAGDGDATADTDDDGDATADAVGAGDVTEGDAPVEDQGSADAEPVEADGPFGAAGRRRAAAGDEEDDGDQHEDGGTFREVDFELSEWGARERKLLDEILEGVRVRRVWQAGTLVVSARDADVVDDLIDEIEDRIALDLPAGVEPVVYDVRDWPEGLEDRFVEALIDQRVPHMRGYQEITVGVDDEERVDGLVEEVTAAWEDEQPEDHELDGPDAQQVLSELFVSADRLLHDASDKTATVRFDDAAGSAASMVPPFGFAESDWAAITAAAAALRERLGDADAGDEDIEEAATALRTLLRPLV